MQLLEKTLIRVGNDEYARANGSFGLTTLHNRHVNVRGRRVTFRFRGKSGREHVIDLADPRLAAVVRRCRELPEQELFAYFDDAGEIQRIGSADVNDYLREISGSDFTAKDFRTWAGTLLALQALKQRPEFSTLAEGKRNVAAAIESVARTLGNTKAVCRKSYVHPALVEAAKERPRDPLPGIEPRPARKWLSSAEVGLIDFLKSQSRRRRKLAKTA